MIASVFMVPVWLLFEILELFLFVSVADNGVHNCFKGNIVKRFKRRGGGRMVGAMERWPKSIFGHFHIFMILQQTWPSRSGPGEMCFGAAGPETLVMPD